MRSDLTPANPLRHALAVVRNGLQCYRNTYREADNGANDEMLAQIVAALAPAPAGAEAWSLAATSSHEGDAT